MHHFLHLLYLLPFFIGLVDGEGAPPEGGDAPEVTPTIDRAADYLKEHGSIFSTEPEPKVEPAKVEPAKTEPAKAEPAKVEGAEPAKAEPVKTEPAKPGEWIYNEKEAAPHINDFEKLPFYKDATFQRILGEHKEFSQQINGLTEIFTKGRYTIDGNETLKGVLEDAYSLYDIGNLKMPVADFFATFEKNFDPEAVKTVYGQIAAYLKTKGIEPGEQLDPKNPVHAKILQMEREGIERRQREKTEAATRTQQSEQEANTKAFDSLQTHVAEWCKTEKIDEQDVLDYMTVVVSQIGGKKEALDQLRSGKFAGVDKILTEYHNRQVARQERWQKAQLAEAEAREKKLPKAQPAGAGRPAGAQAAQPAKINVGDRDERIAEARRQFRG